METVSETLLNDIIARIDLLCGMTFVLIVLVILAVGCLTAKLITDWFVR